VCLSLAVSTARADDAGAPRRLSAPCHGCKALAPDGDEPVPLLVLLHGDGETAGSMFDLWAPAAARRHVAVLALACPLPLGCSPNSWWRWNGDPAWIGRQIDALAEERPVDRRRMWLVGWSGGATYAGYRTQEIERSFAAIVIHGGGTPPASDECSTEKASVYFLVSPSNPFYQHQIWLRQHYEACGQDVVWTSTTTKNHEEERRSLGRYREAILDFLANKTLREQPAPAPLADAGSPASTDPALLGDAVPSAPPPSPAPPLPPPVRSSWRCAIDPSSPWSPTSLVWFSAACARLLRRRVRH
jgi:predicted esterase